MKYHLYRYLWSIWHSRLRRFFDRFGPPCSTCEQARATYRELAAEGYEPAKRALRFPCKHAKYITESRPFWMLCCNGDNGGWRTKLCDHLEHTWRALEREACHEET